MKIQIARKSSREPCAAIDERFFLSGLLGVENLFGFSRLPKRYF